MTNPISNYTELVQEKKRLEALFILQREAVKADWSGIKDDLKPIGLVVNGISMLGKRNQALSFFNPVIDFGVDLILKKFLLRKAGWITRLTVPFLVKNVLSNVAFQKITKEFPAVAEWLAGSKDDSTVDEAELAEPVKEVIIQK